jgi:hypothetical protein
MQYNGYSMRSLPNSVHKREKVYKLQIVDISAIKKIEPVVPDWAAEATKQPLVPAQLPTGVPTQWLMHVPGGTNFRLMVEQYNIFMDQIGEPYNSRIDVL